MVRKHGQIIEGALAAGSVVIRPPRIDVLALAPGTRAGTILPPQRMDTDVADIGVEELMDV
jgi:hypothetical protein